MQEKEALSKCMAICSKAEKCISDIQKKLDTWDIPEEWSHRIIQVLIDEKFIDEGRYARLYVRDKFRFNKWGKIKISYMLKGKGLNPAVIKLALEEIDSHAYMETLNALIQSKSKRLKYKDEYDRKSKLIRFAQGRGFEFESISIVLE